MKSVRAVCRPELAPGFALAGLAAVEAGSPAEGGRRLEALLDEPEAGVVLVEEPFYAALSEESRRRLGRRPLSMVVPFPSPVWAAGVSAEAYVVEILRQAIGYRVRLR